MRLALKDLYQAKWTKDIHREWITSLLRNRPDLKLTQLEAIQKKMDMHVRDCLVEGYEKIINKITLPDPDDRHVLAAAIRAKAQIIVTFNLSDFPQKIIKNYGIKALHPDQFLTMLFEIDHPSVIQTIQETRLSLKNPPKNASEYLHILEQTIRCPKTRVMSAMRLLRAVEHLSLGETWITTTGTNALQPALLPVQARLQHKHPSWPTRLGLVITNVPFQ